MLIGNINREGLEGSGRTAVVEDDQFETLIKIIQVTQR